MGMKTQRTIAVNPRQQKEQTRAFVKECPLHDYDELTRSEKVIQLERRITASNDEEERGKLEG